ncbi:MAG: type II toxin-antitoxin system antitoxin SocA domain-containing protein [Algisphaera sp.]
MASVFDVSAYILHKQGSMTAMKLQKLVYYAQAWHLVWDEAPLHRSKTQAWANGPVVPSLYATHRGKFKLTKNEMSKGDLSALTSAEKTTVDNVLKFYGKKTGQWLSELTHAENPWKNARSGLEPGQRGDAVITHAAMAEYYGSL